jgi:hypothetical protein
VGKKENELTVNDTWGTPKYLFDIVETVLGPIGLDPCSHPEAIVPCRTAILLPEYRPRTNVHAEHVIYGNGLDAVWDRQGLVYVNPPYSTLDAWCQKAAREGDEVLILAPVRTGNVFWPKGAGQCDVEVRLPRVTFRGSKTHAPFHSWLLYFGARVEEAVLGFSEIGEVRVHPRHMTLRPNPEKRWRAA